MLTWLDSCEASQVWLSLGSGSLSAAAQRWHLERGHRPDDAQQLEVRRGVGVEHLGPRRPQQGHRQRRRALRGGPGADHRQRVQAVLQVPDLDCTIPVGSGDRSLTLQTSAMLRTQHVSLRLGDRSLSLQTSVMPRIQHDSQAKGTGWMRTEARECVRLGAITDVRSILGSTIGPNQKRNLAKKCC